MQGKPKASCRKPLESEEWSIYPNTATWNGLEFEVPQQEGGIRGQYFWNSCRDHFREQSSSSQQLHEEEWTSIGRHDFIASFSSRHFAMCSFYQGKQLQYLSLSRITMVFNFLFKLQMLGWLEVSFCKPNSQKYL